MEQKDYLLREIEKIGRIISYIRQLLTGRNESTSLTMESSINQASEMLLKESDFDFNKFLILNIEESNEYISNFKGFSIENIELLADCIYEIWLTYHPSDSNKYLQKALQLYELCNLRSKTYSIKRENQIIAIKNTL